MLSYGKVYSFHCIIFFFLVNDATSEQTPTTRHEQGVQFPELIYTKMYTMMVDQVVLNETNLKRLACKTIKSLKVRDAGLAFLPFFHY